MSWLGRLGAGKGLCPAPRAAEAASGRTAWSRQEGVKPAGSLGLAGTRHPVGGIALGSVFGGPGLRLRLSVPVPVPVPLLCPSGERPRSAAASAGGRGRAKSAACQLQTCLPCAGSTGRSGSLLPRGLGALCPAKGLPRLREPRPLRGPLPAAALARFARPCSAEAVSCDTATA